MLKITYGDKVEWYGKQLPYLTNEGVKIINLSVTYTIEKYDEFDKDPSFYKLVLKPTQEYSQEFKKEVLTYKEFEELIERKLIKLL